MFGISKSKYYYEMNDEQYADMKSFYEKLGYNGDQVKKLCKHCFGADIKVKRSAYYSAEWCFNRGYYSLAPEIKLPKNRRAKSSGAVADGMVFQDSMAMFSGGMAMPQPPSISMAEREPAPMPTPSPSSEFNTAETNAVDENEKHSPFDNSKLIFSANVNTASWSYLRMKINSNRTIDKSFVRIEEIINSFSYDLPKPQDDELFAISAESGKCPWNEDSELLFLGFKGKKADKGVHQNLAFLVDVSGSMMDRWVLVQMSMAAIISKLKKGDTISIIAYSDDTVTVAKQTDCGNIDECIDALLSIDGIGGCTNGSDGLENAYSYLTETYDKDGNNRVFIFTDGDFNFGITGVGGLKDFIYKKRENGIYLSIVGYGSRNFKDNKMEALAQNGNGNYFFVSNPDDILESLWEKLFSNLITVAKDVKISVEFNPAVVSEYRLIGYDSRILTQEEFYDTEKAADGIGSEHNVAALIELKRGKAEKQYPSRYLKVSADENNDELAFIEVHYKSPEGEDLVMTEAVTLDSLKESSDKNIDSAALLAAFGLMVRESEYKGDMTKDKLGGMLDEYMKKHDIKNPQRYTHADTIRRYLK